MKGKNVPAHQQSFQQMQHPHTSMAQKQHNNEKEVLPQKNPQVHIQIEDFRRKAPYQHPTQAYMSTQAQGYEDEFYEEDTFDEAQDWQHHPWKIHEHEDVGGADPGQFHQGRPPIQHRHQQQYGHLRTEFQRTPPTYNAQLLYQHRAVARGPKLTFPEFNGDDADGWIRKAERYFEMVGVPAEEWVKTAVLYVEGKAEYWWRGTG